MTKSRLKAFSDGVLAIIITILVLELKVPHSAELKDLLLLVPIFLSCILSFVFVGIYWGNHHHLIYTVHQFGILLLTVDVSRDKLKYFLVILYLYVAN